ncbi:MAG: PAS domain-containing sensor histidine kinase, partial [Planctomycetaceae bacterium]|nr:PAS domain-containing sensor histidine kinase [Planctomycetaceae bacterium]
MFNVHQGRLSRGILLFAVCLAILSLMALIVTVMILFDVNEEQEVLSQLIRHLPQGDLDEAMELSGELRLHGRLSILLILNAIGTAFAITMVLRGYLTTQQSLRDVKVLAADILASMDAGVITTDPTGRITSINPRGRELINHGDDCVGRVLTDFTAEHALLADICSEVSSLHNCVRDRDYCVEQENHQLTLRAGCTLLKNQRDEEMGTVIHVRDVTQKALLEERLRRMERYMGLGSLAAGLQHEIKNPLSALSLHLQLLQERLLAEDTRPETVETLNILQTEVTRISRVLDGFRNYASLRELGWSPVDVGALVEKLVQLLRPQARNQKVELAIEVPGSVRGAVQADSVQLEQ